MSRLTPSRITTHALLLALTLLLAACAPQTADGSLPTADYSTTDYPTTDYPTPTLLTPTLLTPTPLPPPHPSAFDPA
ncbi:MAG: hypothetical protein ABWK53_05475, partial [Anaerolineales bacterium]